jgi:hypothetical protein
MRRIEVRLDSGLKVKEVIKNDLIVVDQTDQEIVIKSVKTDKYEIIDKIKAKKGFTQFNPLVENVSIADYSRDSFFRDCWGYFVIRLYTTETVDKKISKTMSKAFNKFFKEKQSEYSIYYSGGTEISIEI